MLIGIVHIRIALGHNANYQTFLLSFFNQGFAGLTTNKNRRYHTGEQNHIAQSQNGHTVGRVNIQKILQISIYISNHLKC